MNISIIAAVNRKLALGYRGGLLYRLPADMKRFKELTTGHTVLMGRKTFESLPKGALPNRRNIVLTHRGIDAEGCECYGSMEEALKHCSESEEVFVIGGSSVYAEALPIADRLLMTEVDDDEAEADVFFPEYKRGWKETAREHHPRDERHAQAFDFVDYEREK